MNKKFAIVLALLMVMTTSFVFADVDTTTSASTWVEETPTAVPAKAVPVAVSGNYATYTVKAGDVMWKIAMDNDMTLKELLALNPQIKTPDSIAVGQVLNLKAAAAATEVTGQLYQGLGHSVAFRNGPGSDSEGVPVYSFNIAMASAIFDADGRIVSVFIDGYEVATPNYDGASMPHFSGWPDKEGYNITDHETEKVSGVSVNTAESAAAEVNAWVTKRQRGDSYHMNETNEWYKQMDFYQSFFVGKTVAELEDWFAKNTTSAGRPIKLDTTNEADLAKLAALTPDEMQVHVDVVSGATMSLRDAHGDFLGAVANAYANRMPLK
jgi:LysM repeat protein